MSKDVLDELIFKHLNSQELDYVEFVWHGGEPLLHEDSFFDYIAKKQKEFNRFGTKIVNKIQTNGLFFPQYIWKDAIHQIHLMTFQRDNSCILNDFGALSKTILSHIFYKKLFYPC